jgi:Uma2 family endonuclease
MTRLTTVADLLHRLGDVPPERVRLQPAPGTATEQDVLTIEARENRLCELVEGVLVEKAMGYYESRLAGALFYFLEHFLGKHDLGILVPPDGTVRLWPGLVRIPDISFASWERFPNRELPAESIPDLVPDLAVEVLSESNTKREMKRKLREYFKAGVRLVWLIHPRTHTAQVYTTPGKFTKIDSDQSLEGGAVLPGFALPLRKLFARAGKQRSR